jgi:hypothetical protein
MKQVQVYFAGHLLVSVAALAIGYAMAEKINWAFIFVFFGGFWYYAHVRGTQGIETMLFFGFTLAAAAGFWFGMPPAAMLVGLVAALGAWDLDHFGQRLRLVKRVEMDSGLGGNHLRRLGLIELLGLLAGMAGLTSSLQLTFWVQLLLVVLAIYGISRLVILVKNNLN